MFGFDNAQDSYNQVQNAEPEAKFSHELIGGAAAFAGFKAFEDSQRKSGKPVSHAFAKELLAGFAGAEADRLAETKGMSFVEREEAKHKAKKQSEQMYDSHYGQDQQYDPNQRDAPDQFNNNN